MTDEQIIKALELCFADDFENCEECPLKDKRDSIFSCMRTKQELTHDLIKRQKAEVERLQKIILGFMDEVGTWSNKYDVDISNIHKLPLLAKEDFYIKNKIKSEAIKEFADRVKDKIPKRCKMDGIDTVNVYIYIDNLVKEMTEPVKLEHNSLCETETYMGE